MVDFFHWWLHFRWVYDLMSLIHALVVPLYMPGTFHVVVLVLVYHAVPAAAIQYVHVVIYGDMY